MRRLLAAVLMAVAAPFAAAESIQLGFNADASAFLKIPKEAIRAPSALGGGDETEPFPVCPLGQDCQIPFDFQHVEVTPKQVDVLPASKELAKVDLAKTLDSAARIPEMYWKFNKRMFFTGTAFDRANEVYFAFFTGKAGEEVLEPEGGRLLKKTIPVQLDVETKYVIRLQLDIFNPEKSYLHFNPAKNFTGEPHKVRADEAMKFMRNAGVAVNFSKGTLTFYYATDADAATKKLASTRTLRFVKEDGRNTKSFNVREEELAKEKWHQVDLGGQAALLFRTADDSLLIAEPN